MAEPNTPQWYKEYIPMYVDRITILVTVTALHLALKHPDYPSASEQLTRNFAIALLDRLRADGLTIPPDCWEEYKRDLYQQ